MHRHPDYTARLLQPEAVLGLFALLVQPVLLAVRASEFSACLIRSNIANRHLCTVTLFGSHLDVGICGAAGFAVTCAQMVLASLFLTATTEDPSSRYLKRLAGAGWLMATLLEMLLTVGCAATPREMATAFALALTLTMLETGAGIVIIDKFLVNAILSLGWAIHDALNPGR